MKLKDILIEVGSGILLDAIPYGNTILNAVNKYLSPSNQLPTHSTGNEIADAIDGIDSVNEKLEILNKDFDVKLAEIQADSDKFKAMCEVDATGHTARPEIALSMSRVICFAVICLISLFCIAIYKGDSDTIKAIVDGWPFLFALLGIPAGVVNSYFGKRTKEKQHKYHATTGVAPAQSILHKIISRL